MVKKKLLLFLIIIVAIFIVGCTAEYDVSVEVEPEEAGKITGAGTFEEGEEVTLEAEPEEGYEFKKWSEDGEEISTDGNYSFEIDSDRKLTAEFVKKEYEVEVSVQYGNSEVHGERGSVSGGGTYEHGEEATVEAEPKKGYTFKNWTVDDEEISTNEKYKFKVESDKKLAAHFEAVPTDDLIEMRGSDLRLRQEKLDSLSLDGEHYEFPKEVLEMLHSSRHININYPLVSDMNKVYNLEKEKLLFTVEDIISSLEKEWGKAIDVNNVQQSFGEKELEPDNFNVIDNASLSPSTEKVAFSVHYSYVDIITSVIGIFDMKNNEVDFVQGPSEPQLNRQVNEISWSPDEKHFAYIIGSYVAEGEEGNSFDLYVINSKECDETTSADLLELFEDVFEDEISREGVQRKPRIKLSQWLDNRRLTVQLGYVGKDDNVKEEVTKSIKY